MDSSGFFPDAVCYAGGGNRKSRIPGQSSQPAISLYCGRYPRFLGQENRHGQRLCHRFQNRYAQSAEQRARLRQRSDFRLHEASVVIQHSGSSVHPKRQQKPYPHCIMVSPDNRFVLVSDFGLDQILVYRFDPEKGSLAPNDPPFVKLSPGEGQRHFAFHPNGRFVYSINELQSTVTTFAYDASAGITASPCFRSTVKPGHSRR